MLIVSLLFCSMDVCFKGGMNCVLEVIVLVNDLFVYYINWFVVKIGWVLI